MGQLPQNIPVAPPLIESINNSSAKLCKVESVFGDHDDADKEIHFTYKLKYIQIHLNDLDPNTYKNNDQIGKRILENTKLSIESSGNNDDLINISKTEYEDWIELRLDHYSGKKKLNLTVYIKIRMFYITMKVVKGHVIGLLKSGNSITLKS